MNKQERINTFKNTVQLVNQGKYINQLGQEIIINQYDEYMMNNTKFYGKKPNIDFQNITRYDTEVEVVNNDCIYETEKLIKQGLKPALLNMASFATPGGGVINGSSAQEESIFRRTNIFKSLYQFHYIGENYNITQREERYPLDYNFGGIYSPKVTVFKLAEKDNCNLINQPFQIDVISVSAIKKPKVKNNKLLPWVEDTAKNKIRQIFNIALDNDNDALVLSAFGCGAYGTPPNIMAKLFADVLTEESYHGAFKKIIFAIIELTTTNGQHNPNGNFKPFKDIFG